MPIHKLKIGALDLTLHLREDGFLAEVRLPALPPEQLLPEHLKEASERLRSWRIPPPSSEGEARFRNALEAIEPGAPRSYGALALALGTSPRAIASRCAANRFLLRIPCHRVVGKHGIGGFRCGIAWKTTLLQLELQETAPALIDLL
jgi:O-6-methylguanine DNA methyltransferase